MEYKDGRKGGFDPHARIPDMDLDGIDAAFLYPSLGLFAGAVTDPGFAAAMCRAYNRWLADYCKPYPDRLFGVAMLPMQSIEAAIQEMRFARKELGMRGGFLRPNPYNDRKLHHPDYEPFWSEVQELDFCDRHPRRRQRRHADGRRRPLRRPRRAAHHLAHHGDDAGRDERDLGRRVRPPSHACAIGFLESGGGWIAPWLDRMDRHFDDQGFNDSGLTMRPSELFRRNCWISFEPVEGCLERAGRLHRPAQDPVGHRLSASRRLLPRRAADDAGAAEGPVGRDEARDHGRRRHGVLRPPLKSSAGGAPLKANVNSPKWRVMIFP